MNKTQIILLVFLMFSLNLQAQKPILFIGGTAHLGNGKSIENSAISILNGEFELVANASKIRINPEAFDTIYRIQGKHIYPGFIAPNSTLGITEIGAIRASHDYRETGNINPNVRSLIAYNTESKIIKTVRTNGILIAQISPQGGLISGQSSIMYLDGSNWEDAQLKSDDGIHVNWPSSYYSTGWWAQPGEIKENEEYENKIQEIKHVFDKAYAYYQSSSLIDLRLESMKGLFNGNKTLYIYSNQANDIRDAIEFTNKFKIKKTVLVGGEEALEIKKLLKQNNISLILNRIHRLPNNQDSPIDGPYSQPSKLQEAGITFCLSYEGDMEAMGTRNLPFTAGTTVAYGQKYENAVMSLTLNAAKILGIDHRVGSIEKGKEATFFISTGDALDIKTNNVEKAFIKGKEVDLNNHQIELFNKYKDK